MRNLTVDMDFLSKTLKWLSPHIVRIQLLGGEPGLIKNLDEVVDEIKKHKNLIPSILSNSFVRKRYPYMLDDPSILYQEHLVLDFHENKIEKLGNFDFFKENDNNNYNIIIMTPNYFKYRKKHDLDKVDHKNTQFKKFNSRSPNFLNMEQAPEFDRRMCAAFPKVPVIDFELQRIRHCSKKVINGSRRYAVTKENIDKMMNYELFAFEQYCNKCFEPIDKRPQEQILDIISVGKVMQ